MPESKRTREQNRKSRSVKQLREHRKAAGLCIDCGNPSDMLRCSSCRKKNADVQKRRREAGTFKKASAEKQSGYARRHRDKARANGLCAVCGKETGTRLVRCAECNKASNKRNQKRREKYSEEGRCRECGAEAQLTNRSLRGKDRGNYCKGCWLKVLAMTTLGSTKMWPTLVEKLDNCNWTCPYTGERLVIGENLSFDHMDPVSRFPEKRHDPNNVEPVSWKINLMKRDLTKQEFLALIEKVYHYTRKE